MTDIPPDILAHLGELTEKQQGVIERLLANVGEARTRELLAEAQTRLAIPNEHPAAPKTVRGMLTQMIQTEFPPDQRNVILNITMPADALPVALVPRWHAVCVRLGETKKPPMCIKLSRGTLLWHHGNVTNPRPRSIPCLSYRRSARPCAPS